MKYVSMGMPHQGPFGENPSRRKDTCPSAQLSEQTGPAVRRIDCFDCSPPFCLAKTSIESSAIHPSETLSMRFELKCYRRFVVDRLVAGVSGASGFWFCE